MLKTFISLIVDFAISVFMKLRTVNRDEEIGVLKMVNKQNAEALKDEQIAKNVSDRIDGLPDDRFDGLSATLNDRHRG